MYVHLSQLNKNICSLYRQKLENVKCNLEADCFVLIQLTYIEEMSNRKLIIPFSLLVRNATHTLYYL